MSESKLSRATMIRRLTNAMADNLSGCDSETSLPEILVGGFRGYGEMNMLELMNEYAKMFHVGELDDETFAMEFDDKFPYFENSKRAWDADLRAEVAAQRAEKP